MRKGDLFHLWDCPRPGWIILGLEQPGIEEDVTAHGKGWRKWALKSFLPKLFYDRPKAEVAGGFLALTGGGWKEMNLHIYKHSKAPAAPREM